MKRLRGKELLREQRRKKEEREVRIIKEAIYLVETRGTYRSVGKKFNTSKSNIENHMNKDLPLYSSTLYSLVRNVVDKNLKERHLRGGASNALKYKLASIIEEKGIEVIVNDYNKDLLDENSVVSKEFHICFEEI